MQQETVRSILRIIAVTGVMIGIVMILQSILQLMMIGSITSGSMGRFSISAPGIGGGMGFYLILSQACISVAGLALYKFSDSLAERIVEVE